MIFWTNCYQKTSQQHVSSLHAFMATVQHGFDRHPRLLDVTRLHFLIRTYGRWSWQGQDCSISLDRRELNYQIQRIKIQQFWKTVKSCLSDKTLYLKIFNIIFKDITRYLIPSRYYFSPFSGVKCNKKNWKWLKFTWNKKNMFQLM